MGRVYSSVGGWTQYRGSITPTAKWDTIVNTSIWNGTGAIAPGAGVTALMNNVRIESDGILDIPAGKWLTVSGTLTNLGGAAGLVVESGISPNGDGSLIQSTANVPATVRRYITDWSAGALKGWHLLSSPMDAQPFQSTFVTSPPDATQDFFLWDESQGLWINSKLGATPPYTFNTAAFGSAFSVGKGYLCAYSPATAGTKNFTGGFLNVNNPTVSVQQVGPGGWSEAGWNLLGNPYSSSLLWNNGSWTLTNVDALAQIWSEQNASYSVINTSGIIPPTQGFMVHASAASGSVTIPASARTHNSAPWYKSSGNPYIKLVAHNPSSQTAQESVVSFVPQSTTGYDPDYDSYFQAGYAPSFYSVAGTEALAYNSLPVLESTTVVPLNFVKTEGSTYYIDAETIDNMPQDVYLTDLKLDIVQNLVQNPKYYFTSFDPDDPARFLLSFTDNPTTGTGNETGEPISVYTFGNDLFIAHAGKARAEIFNMNGQRLQSLEIDNPGLFKKSLSLPTAYYIVRVTSDTKVIVRRVFIKS